jgi:cell division protein FtsL
MARGSAATAPVRGSASARGAAPARAPARPRPASPPRRRSGPAQPARRPRPAPRVDARGSAALALGRFLEARTQGLVERLLRGRLWVGFVGVLLAGIVFLNVSLLQLNQEIARTAVHATALDRQNSGLRARLSALDSSDRIQRLAEQHGMTMPAPGQYRYLRARPWLDSELAARRTVPPHPSAPAAATVAQSTIATTPAPAPAPPQTSPATATPAATATATAAPPTATAGTP